MGVSLYVSRLVVDSVQSRVPDGSVSCLLVPYVYAKMPYDLYQGRTPRICLTQNRQD
jgi:hypothetical protein